MSYIEDSLNYFFSLPKEERLRIIVAISKILCEHVHKSGSFRCLIYDKLRFDPEDYGTLRSAGLFEILNKLIE
ncbi:hypothetical protein DRN58_01265 [Thermococci archaeon]|nr:MAG: hypothetical protein DRN58_01265 [Thermococci archaeon]